MNRQRPNQVQGDSDNGNASRVSAVRDISSHAAFQAQPSTDGLCLPRRRDDGPPRSGLDDRSADRLDGR